MGDNDVLIQVWAVGVDDVDRRLVCPMPSAPGMASASEPSVGWVPGRSVVGRVVEVGALVKDDVCRRGDWVAGLLDIRQGGGLTEFALMERHKLVRVSHPVEAFRDEADDSEEQRHHASHTLEELALLPLCGVPAYRAFRTFVTSFDNKEKPRVLILRGEEGTGSLVGQALARLGWRVVVHCRLPEDGTPRSSRSGPSTPASSQEGLDSASVNSLPSWMCCDPQVLEARVKKWGAERIVFGQELDVLARLAGDKSPEATFDGILDTVGGKDIWEASERLLRSSASSKGHRQLFTTLVGDNPSRPVPTNRSNFLSSMRSWGRDGDGKVGYVWLSVAQDLDWEGRDVRDALGAVANGGALGEGVRPWVGGSVTLDRAMSVFDGVGSVVARIV